MIKICERCKKEFKSLIVIDGKKRNIINRRYCFECSPWGSHNKKNLNNVDREKEGYKTCSKCQQEKDISCFRIKKSENRFESWCRRCLYDSQMKSWKEKKKVAIDYKGGKCEICGYDRCPNVLEFHHKDPEGKEMDWTKMRLKTFDKIEKELDKCILVCSNCHREIHWKIFEKNA